MHVPRRADIVTGCLFITSLVILGATVAYNVRVEVLQDWVITLPVGDIHAGDTITIQSTYTKLRAVSGQAHRYLECQNQTGALVRYELNQAKADRAPGTRTGTGVVIKMPLTVPDLPAKCRISINIVYPVYPWRSVTEFQSTKYFQFLPAVTAASESSATRQTNPNPVSVIGQSTVPSPNTTVSPNSAQSNPSQSTTQPSLLDRVTSPVTQILRFVF